MRERSLWMFCILYITSKQTSTPTSPLVLEILTARVPLYMQQASKQAKTSQIHQQVLTLEHPLLPTAGNTNKSANTRVKTHFCP